MLAFKRNLLVTFFHKKRRHFLKTMLRLVDLVFKKLIPCFSFKVPINFSKNNFSRVFKTKNEIPTLHHPSCYYLLAKHH